MRYSSEDIFPTVIYIYSNPKPDLNQNLNLIPTLPPQKKEIDPPSPSSSPFLTVTPPGLSKASIDYDSFLSTNKVVKLFRIMLDLISPENLDKWERLTVADALEATFFDDCEAVVKQVISVLYNAQF